MTKNTILSHQKFTEEQLNLIREWFDSVQDINPDYLEPKDYALAKIIYEQLNMRVPSSILENL